MKGELAGILGCLNPGLAVPAWALAKLGCKNPADEFPETRDDCPECRTRMWCDKVDDAGRFAHGHMYVGLAGHGFRTNRCPATWAATRFAHETMDAYGWSEKGGGGFLAAFPRPSALLLNAIAFYGHEVGARQQHDWAAMKETT